MTHHRFAICVAMIVAAMRTPAQQMVCGKAEYEAMLRKSPPSAEWMHYSIPPGARIDIQNTMAQGWPRRSFSQTIVYDFPPGTKLADVERFFVQAGVYRASPSGAVYTDVNPRRGPGDSMRKVTEDDGVVTFTIHRNTRPSPGRRPAGSPGSGRAGVTEARSRPSPLPDSKSRRDETGLRANVAFANVAFVAMNEPNYSPRPMLSVI